MLPTADSQTEIQAGPLQPIPEGPCGYVSNSRVREDVH
jgi:hypothetical protein